MTELWQKIPGFENYEASSDGRIRSLDRVLCFVGRWGAVYRRHRGKLLALKRKPNGYLFFCTDGQIYLHVNRAVAMAFHGLPPSEKHEAAHLDRDTSNNRPSNIVWATPKENAAHKIGHGTVPAGSKNGASKITEGQAAEIIRRYAQGEWPATIASDFGIAAAYISAIATGRAWAHVPSPHRNAAKVRARLMPAITAARANRKRHEAVL